MKLVRLCLTHLGSSWPSLVAWRLLQMRDEAATTTLIPAQAATPQREDTLPREVRCHMLSHNLVCGSDSLFSEGIEAGGRLIVAMV